MHTSKKGRRILKRGVASANKQKMELAIFISNKVDFEAKSIAKQYRYILMIKGEIHKDALQTKSFNAPIT